MGVSPTKALTSILSPIETLIVAAFRLADACRFVIMFPDRQSAWIAATGVLTRQINVVLAFPSKTLPYLPF